MGNYLAGPDCFVCELIYHDQSKDDFKLMKPRRNYQLEALYKIVQDLNNRICMEETKLETYKAQNKDLSLLTSILIAEKTSLIQENDQLRTMRRPLSYAQWSLLETQV